MRTLGLSRVRRGKGIRTTIPAKDGTRGPRTCSTATSPPPHRPHLGHRRQDLGQVRRRRCLDVFARRIVAWHAAMTQQTDLAPRLPQCPVIMPTPSARSPCRARHPETNSRIIRCSAYRESCRYRHEFHKIANVLKGALPKSAQPGAKAALTEIWNAEDREYAEQAVKAFERDLAEWA